MFNVYIKKLLNYNYLIGRVKSLWFLVLFFIECLRQCFLTKNCK